MHAPRQELHIGRREQFRLDSEAIEEIEAAHDFASQFDVRDLIFAHGNKVRVVHHNVRRLQNRIAEKAVRVQVLVLHVVERFFVGGHAFEPAERRDHREQQMQLGVFRDGRLDEHRALRGIEARGEPVGGDFDCVLRDLRCVGVVRRQRVPIGDEEKTFVLRIVLELDPIFEGAEVVADVEAPGGAHAAQDSFLVRGSVTRIGSPCS